MTSSTLKCTNLYDLESKMLPPSTFEHFKAAYETEGIDINSQDLFGFTLLHHAVGRSKLEIIEFLLEQGARINITNHLDQTALDLAQKDGKTEIVAALTKGKELQVLQAESEGALTFQKQVLQEQPLQQQGQLGR